MKGKKHHKAGGRTHMRVSGNPDVFEEAEDKPGTAKKRGRAHHRATGGKVETKSLGYMTGGMVRPRLDRPGRKRGGRIRGFQIGGAPGSAGNVLSDTFNRAPMQIGHTMPNAPAVCPSGSDTSQLGQAIGAAAGDLHDQYVGSADTNVAFGPRGEVISAKNYEEGAAHGGRVRGRLDENLAHASGAKRGGRIRRSKRR